MSASANLGKLKKVDLREGWRHEANNFTQWLAEEKNLELLGDEIGLDIKLIQTEAAVGSFNVDILAEEEGTGRKIIIENQLEVTNHDHLGKIITYASGYDAEFILWIVKDVREEHRQAIDWLNEHTSEEIEFYLLKIELWQIEDSLYAPKFEVISKPNDWTKTVRSSAESGALTDTRIKQLDFWNGLKDYAKVSHSDLRFQKSYPHHWLDAGIGVSNAHLSLKVNSREKTYSVEIWISNDKELYFKLFKYKAQIEKEIGEKLDWRELPERKASRIIIAKSGDYRDVDAWEQYYAWMLEKSESFKKVFPKYIKLEE